MIEVSHLSRTYGGLRAVDDVTFTARPGRVTGFLGPNGAGKSTTMRVMVGLTPATSGSATVLGRRYADLPNPGREVGVLLDASAQHAGRTGRETLRIAARTMGLPASRADEMIDLVGLTGPRPAAASRTTRSACASGSASPPRCIGDPEVLILDEPANGLDPAGIRWMRDLLRGLRRPGRHRAAVLAPAPRDRGHRRRPGRHRPGPDRRPGHQVRAAGRRRHLRALELGHRARPGAHRLRHHRHPSGDDILRADAEPELVGKVALAAGIALSELRAADGAGLEEMFLELTADTAREGVAA